MHGNIMGNIKAIFWSLIVAVNYIVVSQSNTELLHDVVLYNMSRIYCIKCPLKYIELVKMKHFSRFVKVLSFFCYNTNVIWDLK